MAEKNSGTITKDTTIPIALMIVVVGLVWWMAEKQTWSEVNDEQHEKRLDKIDTLLESIGSRLRSLEAAK